MNLFKLAGVLAFGFVLGTTAFAQEFAVSSSTNLGFASPPAAPLSLSQRLDGQYSLSFDKLGSGLEVRAHAQAAALPSPASLGADLDMLAVTLVFPQPASDLKALKWTLGRFAVSEPTGLILNLAADGTKLDFDYNGFDLSVTTAYTGFVFRASSGVTLTLADQAAANELFASPRFIGSVEGSMNLFKAHRFTLSALAQQDLNPRDRYTPEWSSLFTGERGGALDTQYLTFKAQGPVTGVDRLFYEAFGTFGAGSTLSWLTDTTSPTGYVYQYKPILASLFGTTFSYFLPQTFSSSYSLRVLIASGDVDATSAVEGNSKDDSNLFVPVTPGSLGVVFNPALSNLVFYELGGSLKPVDGMPLVVGVKLLGFQRAVLGVVGAPGVQRTGPGWLGQELDVTSSWQALSDLTVSASVGAFIPSAGTFASGTPEAGLQYAVKTGVNLSL